MKNEALQFKRFLKLNNAWDQFIKNIQNPKGIGFAGLESISQYFERIRPDDYLNGAFDLNTKDSGIDWRVLSVEWTRLLRGNPEKVKLEIEFSIPKMNEIKHAAKMLGVGPETFIHLASRKYVLEVLQNIEQGEEVEK